MIFLKIIYYDFYMIFSAYYITTFFTTLYNEYYIFGGIFYHIANDRKTPNIGKGLAALEMTLWTKRHQTAAERRKLS